MDKETTRAVWPQLTTLGEEFSIPQFWITALLFYSYVPMIVILVENLNINLATSS